MERIGILVLSLFLLCGCCNNISDSDPENYYDPRTNIKLVNGHVYLPEDIKNGMFVYSHDVKCPKCKEYDTRQE